VYGVSKALPAFPLNLLLVAQTLCERASIVSADTVFDAYPITRVW
jgi:PIN domain nuclease of toxin-antitoxin system